MSVIARRVASTPKRTAADTWQVIIDMVSDQSSTARKTLESIAGVVSAIMVDEVPAEAPIVFTGKGPRIRIYCVYGEETLLDENCNEEPFVQKLTTEDWHMYLPCAKEDWKWVSESLSAVSNFITIYDKDKELDTEKGTDETASLTIDTSSFLNKL